MSRAIEEVNEYQTLIFNKLETIELTLKHQEEDIKAYIEQSPTDEDSNKLIIAGLKSTRTSFELLCDEIEEIHLLIAELFQHIKKKNEGDNR